VKGFLFPPDVYTNLQVRSRRAWRFFERCAYAGSGSKQEEVLVHAGRESTSRARKLLKPVTEYRGNKLARTWNKIQVQAFNCDDSLEIYNPSTCGSSINHVTVLDLLILRIVSNEPVNKNAYCHTLFYL